MRTTMACNRCRRMKTKCNHNGKPPCRGCVRGDAAEPCVLSHTATARKSGARSLAGRTTDTTTRIRRPRHTTQSDQNGSFDDRLQIIHAVSDTAGDDVNSLVDGLDADLFARCFSALRLQFPEFGFLHPRDLEWTTDGISQEAKLRILAIVTVGSRYLGQKHDYSSVVARELQTRLLALPSITLMQVFLIMALHAWGQGSGYQAWIYSGHALRMSQVYQAPRGSANHEHTRAIAGADMPEDEVRTRWACFILDKLLSSGKQRPPMMDIRDIEARLPASDEAFAFDNKGTPVTYTDLYNNATLRRSHGKLEYNLEIIIRGLEIWSRAHSWVVKGGRKQQGMTDVENCPWRSTSRWAKLKTDLIQWREEQDTQLMYPETGVSPHVYLGRSGQAFGYINLIYYLTTIFLCREFLPFLPRSRREPCGPIDPPFFPEDAPEGWWMRNAHELFDSAARITSLTRDMRKASVSLHTPFSGLCTFTSAQMNLFAASFPFLNRPSEQAMRRQLVSEDLLHLNELARLWPMAHEWIQVVDIAHGLYGRLHNDPDLFAHQSRDDYVELESSINLEPLIGLSPASCRREAPSAVRQSVEATPRRAGEVGNRDRVPPIRAVPPGELGELRDEAEGPVMDSSAPGPQDTVALEEVESYLWSFWDDPQLLRWENSAMI